MFNSRLRLMYGIKANNDFTINDFTINDFSELTEIEDWCNERGLNVGYDGEEHLHNTIMIGILIADKYNDFNYEIDPDSLKEKVKSIKEQLTLDLVKEINEYFNNQVIERPKLVVMVHISE